MGDRAATLRAAIVALRATTRLERVSRVYETSPIGGPAQGDYLNAAVLVESRSTPVGLLAELQAVEARLGRVRAERWGPRVIDLDLLWIEGLVVDTPELRVPHPRLLERAFALVPLLDVADGAVDPRSGQRFAMPLDVTGLRTSRVDLRGLARSES